MPINMSTIAYERSQRWQERSKLIPPLQFPSDWLVKLAMPFADATARFYVKSGNRTVSVYFDTEGSLGGSSSQPYWEMYPNIDGNEERFLAGEEVELIDAIQRIFDNPDLDTARQNLPF